LAAQSGSSRPGGRRNALQLLDEVPPDAVQVLPVGVGVELLLEPEHHERPPRKDEQVFAPPREELLLIAGEVPLRHPGHCPEPAGLLGQRTHHEGYGLGGGDVGDAAQEVGELRVYVRS
jgi:hypothetical protein